MALDNTAELNMLTHGHFVRIDELEHEPTWDLIGKQVVASLALHVAAMVGAVIVGWFYNSDSRWGKDLRFKVRVYMGTQYEPPKSGHAWIYISLLVGQFVASAMITVCWVIKTYIRRVPDTMWAIELLCCVVCLLHWAADLLKHSFSVGCLFSLPAILDSLTIVPILLQTTMIEGWLSLAYLRAVRLAHSYTLIDASGVMENFHELQRGLAVIAFQFISLVIAIAGTFFVLELLGDISGFYDLFITASDELDALSFSQMCYFTMTTISTVGYGDFVPRTLLGRWFCMASILTGVGFFHFALQKLLTLKDVQAEGRGSHKNDPRRAHVVLLGGAVSKGNTVAVEAFLSEMLQPSLRASWPWIVMMSQTEPARHSPAFKKFLNQQWVKESAKYLNGFSLKHADLARAGVANASLVMVLADFSAKDPDKEDEENVLRANAVHRLFPDTPLRVMLIRPENRMLAVHVGMPPNTTYSMNEIKSDLVSLAARSQGISTLIINMLRYSSHPSPDEEERMHAAISVNGDVDKRWVAEYISGLECNIAGCHLDSHFAGVTFRQAAMKIFRKTGDTLLAVQTPVGHVKVNPGSGYRLGVGDVAFVIIRNPKSMARYTAQHSALTWKGVYNRRRFHPKNITLSTQNLDQDNEEAISALGHAAGPSVNRMPSGSFTSGGARRVSGGTGGNRSFTAPKKDEDVGGIEEGGFQEWTREKRDADTDEEEEAEPSPAPKGPAASESDLSGGSKVVPGDSEGDTATAEQQPRSFKVELAGPAALEGGRAEGGRAGSVHTTRSLSMAGSSARGLSAEERGERPETPRMWGVGAASSRVITTGLEYLQSKSMRTVATMAVKSTKILHSGARKAFNLQAGWNGEGSQAPSQSISGTEDSRDVTAVVSSSLSDENQTMLRAIVSEGGHLLVLGFQTGLWEQIISLLRPLREMYLPVIQPVVVMVPDEPPAALTEMFELVVYVRGIASRVRTLLAVGANVADKVLTIQSTPDTDEPNMMDAKVMLLIQQLDLQCRQWGREVFTLTEVHNPSSVVLLDQTTPFHRAKHMQNKRRWKAAVRAIGFTIFCQKCGKRRRARLDALAKAGGQDAPRRRSSLLDVMGLGWLSANPAPSDSRPSENSLPRHSQAFTATDGNNSDAEKDWETNWETVRRPRGVFDGIKSAAKSIDLRRALSIDNRRSFEDPHTIGLDSVISEGDVDELMRKLGGEMDGIDVPGEARPKGHKNLLLPNLRMDLHSRYVSGRIICRPDLVRMYAKSYHTPGAMEIFEALTVPARRQQVAYTWMINLPIIADNEDPTYGDLFDWLMAEDAMPIGLYRDTAARGNDLEYVYTCPDAATKLHPNDCVYVVASPQWAYAHISLLVLGGDEEAML